MSDVYQNLIISLIGGSPGYVSAAYLLWKKFKKNLRVLEITGTYEVEASKVKGLDDIKSIIEVGFFNDSDETISITDIVGYLKYNTELYQQAFSSINTPTPPQINSQRPTNFHEVVNFSIAPHETVKKTIVITFPEMLTVLIERLGIAHFMGFLDNKTPIFNVYETELKEKWSAHPLNALLSIHIDGKRIVDRSITLFQKTDSTLSGTLSVIDIEKTKRKFQEENSEKRAFKLT